jgi:NCAIR mutase (PurE)-related protein
LRRTFISQIDNGFKAAIDHAFAIEDRVFGVHHRVHTRIFHDFSIHAIAMGAIFVNYEGKDHRLAGPGLHHFWEWDAPFAFEVIAGAFFVTECTVFHPDLAGLLRDAAVILNSFDRNRQNITINVCHNLLCEVRIENWKGWRFAQVLSAFARGEFAIKLARVTPGEAKEILRNFRAGELDEAAVLAAFETPKVADLGFAQVDLQRGVRTGFPEVIFGSGKTPEQVAKIAQELLRREDRVLVTRITAAHFEAVKSFSTDAVHHELARCITITKAVRPKRAGTIAVVCAGTSDLPVAEEAAITADVMGNTVTRISDVGVAGLHRLLGRIEEIRRANVVVVVAGMEGALPSVVAGMVDRPVIAVPTSIGYGASFGGLAALLGMLNSCGSGVTVVNIDNGFGAGFAASQINRLAARE